MLQISYSRKYGAIKKATWELMENNKRICGRYQYTVPSPDSYPYQWLWDSCFHAIILTHLNPNDAKAELLSLVAKQFDKGMIPHMIYWEKFTNVDFPVIEWGKIDTSNITQPPLIAYSALRIYKINFDKQFLKQIYPKLKKHYNYLLTERNPRKSFLLGIINPDESGEDNSPRFDTLLNLPPMHSLDVNFERRLGLVEKDKKWNFEERRCMEDFFWVKDVPFNVIVIKALEDLAEIALILNIAKDAQYFDQAADKIREAMREKMMENGIFYSVYGEDYEKIKIKTWAIFIPMFARLYTYDEARRLIGEYLLSKSHFDRPFMVPSVSKDEPSYDPSGPWRGIAKMLSTHLSWRGPIWLGVNWFVFKGLINYGFFDMAEQIRESSLKLLEKGGFREQYNPETGEGFGAKQFSWGGLILDMKL